MSSLCLSRLEKYIKNAGSYHKQEIEELLEYAEKFEKVKVKLVKKELETCEVIDLGF